jgi:hypothetical protein
MKEGHIEELTYVLLKNRLLAVISGNLECFLQFVFFFEIKSVSLRWNFKATLFHIFLSSLLWNEVQIKVGKSLAVMWALNPFSSKAIKGQLDSALIQVSRTYSLAS